LRYGFIPAPWTAFEGYFDCARRFRSDGNAQKPFSTLIPIVMTGPLFDISATVAERFEEIMWDPSDQLAMLMGNTVPSLLATLATSMPLPYHKPRWLAATF